MKSVDRKLEQLKHHIINDTYEALETDRFEIKDNSSSASQWKEVHKSTCAFLNTSGGIILIGIHEDLKKNKYILKGYNEEQENKLNVIGQQFSSSTNTKDSFDVSDYIHSEIRDFMNVRILLLFVEKLPDEHKFVYYKSIAYERRLTADEKIEPAKNKAHQEYKEEIKEARELMPVVNTSLSDLSVDKLNEYIQYLNKEKKIETMKADIHSAKSFLRRKGFIRHEDPTVLGMLVCGMYLDDFLGFKAQVDCFVESVHNVVDNKKIIRDNVLDLMEKANHFVTQNIQSGISYINGGKEISEYPPNLIRESINNALAHRDYSLNRYVTVSIKPNSRIEIRNPGRFKQQLLIEKVHDEIPVRRIIPNNPKTINPRLADVLKVFDKWEGKGIGMSSLTQASLENKIDLPYYIFHSPEELSLVIRKGKLVDEKFEVLLAQYDGFIQNETSGRELTTDHITVLAYFYKSEIANKNDHYTILLTKDNNHLNAIQDLEQYGLIKKHVASDSYNMIYIVAREFFQQDHFSELRLLFEKDFDMLSNDYKKVLNTIFHYNKFSTVKLTAQQIGDTIWIEQGNAKVIEGFETFKRKVRNITQKLKAKNFLLKKDGFQVNVDYKNPNLFSHSNQ